MQNKLYISLPLVLIGLAGSMDVVNLSLSLPRRPDLVHCFTPHDLPPICYQTQTVGQEAQIWKPGKSCLHSQRAAPHGHQSVLRIFKKGASSWLRISLPSVIISSDGACGAVGLGIRIHE